MGRIGGNLQKVAVVHGDGDQLFAFVDTLSRALPKAEILVPDYGQAIDFA
jgi:hypothetical protein